MILSGKKIKVHWLYDPTDESKILNKKIAKILLKFSEKQEVEIQPIYFFDHKMSEWGAEISSEFENSYIRELTEEMVAQLVKFEGLNFLAPQIFASDSASQRGLAAEAARYLKKVNSELAVLTTHARTGITRLVMGSFAESLLLKSQTPLLMVSPYAEKVFDLNEIFYPTDFSKKGRDLFEKFLEHPCLTGKTYHLFHKLEAPFSDFERGKRVALQGGLNSVAQFEAEQKERVEKYHAEWSALAKSSDSRVDLILAESKGRLSDVMLDEIERVDPDLIVMPSLVGAVDSIFVGSVAADVIRNSKRPVLVQHLS